jgi:hypothetical protein
LEGRWARAVRIHRTRCLGGSPPWRWDSHPCGAAVSGGPESGAPWDPPMVCWTADEAPRVSSRGWEPRPAAALGLGLMMFDWDRIFGLGGNHWFFRKFSNKGFLLAVTVDKNNFSSWHGTCNPYCNLRVADTIGKFRAVLFQLVTKAQK